MSEPERDLIGYADQPPPIRWPNGARLALSLVVNYEEGAERTYADGDPTQEAQTEWGTSPVPPGVRDLSMESMYEYGSRVGVWRILDVLSKHQAPSTFFAAARAFERAPAVASEVVRRGHEVCSHGLRWEQVWELTREQEMSHIREAIESFEKSCGQRPVGWYCRYGPSVSTRRLLMEEGGFLYDSDSYNDDTPYLVERASGKPHVVVPYTPDVNDMQYWLGNAFTSEDFLSYATDAFDTLYSESEVRPRMMSMGLHCRIIGRPGRIKALDDFLSYVRSFSDVWVTTREDIARWWLLQSGEDYGKDG